MHEVIIRDWLSYLAAERGLSPRTQAAYSRDIVLLSESFPQQSLSTLGGQEIRRALTQLHKAGLSGRSLARVLSAWRGFFTYLLRKKLMSEQNPCSDVRAPQSPQTLPHSLSVDQAARLIDAPMLSHALQVRDRAIAELFYSSGLRLSELASLCWSQLDFQQGGLRVVGKGNKTRVVPMGNAAIIAVQRWLAQQQVSQSVVAQHYIFPGRQLGQHLSQRAIQLRIAYLAQSAGLDEHVHPHMLRHAFASHVLQSSGDLRAVQELLGHEHIRSTQIYTRLDFQHLAKVYDETHPRAKKK